MSELKPCPFCGNTTVSLLDEQVYYKAICDGCYASTLESDDRDRAISMWNTRHIPEGYAMVPVEPTGEMIAYGAEALKWQDYDTDAESCYRAMVAAAQEKNE